MPRPKGSKNKPKEGKIAKPTPAKKATKPSAPVNKKASEEVAKAHGATTGTINAKKTKDGGVVMAATKDTSGEPKKYDVVMRGGQAVKVESTDEPELD